MTPLEELINLANEKGRRVFVAERPVDLRSVEGDNCVYVLQLPASAPGAAGGRIGGIGERRIERLLCFRQVNGKWIKVFETEDLNKLDQFELPYHASGLSIVLPDGTERVVSGVVDEEFTQKYDQTSI